MNETGVGQEEIECRKNEERKNSMRRQNKGRKK